ncbi:LacI family transcriptional regulator [Devosia pacifica]|uniref:LacI family transcriptional regulator n=1 Tax=Devosia pacifica TaxID=1335967 RepID=A0A918RT64_9HYPH|nr:LacI family transcriptional regulator [Devosia pacifica]
MSSPERVSVRTRERIDQAIAATGYTLNQAAQSLRRQRAKTIVIALPNVGNPFYSTILDAVVMEAGEHGYGVLVANRQPDDPIEWLRDYFFSSRADGLVLFDATLDAPALQSQLAAHGDVPFVVVADEVVEPFLNLVTSDNYDASRRAVQHLVALGHTKIGHLSGPQIGHYRNERTAGFIDAMKANDLKLCDDWLMRGNHVASSGFAAAENFLRMTNRPSALFCANDEMALGFISRVHQAGLTCPQDVSLVGFDDISMAEFLSPPLTTMRQKRNELGRLSTEALISLIEGRRKPQPPFRATLRCELVVRGSTAPPCS